MSPLPEEYVRTIAVGLNVTLLLACLTVENAVRAGLVGSIASWLGLDEYWRNIATVNSVPRWLDLILGHHAGIIWMTRVCMQVLWLGHLYGTIFGVCCVRISLLLILIDDIEIYVGCVLLWVDVYFVMLVLLSLECLSLNHAWLPPNSFIPDFLAWHSALAQFGTRTSLFLHGYQILER